MNIVIHEINNSYGNMSAYNAGCRYNKKTAGMRACMFRYANRKF